MSGHFSDSYDHEELQELGLSTALRKPKKFIVFLLNDDYTPMHFVVEVLEQFFGLEEALAIRIMLEVHILGKGVCGIFTRDIAETKVALVNEYARMNEYPLLCTMEPETNTGG